MVPYFRKMVIDTDVLDVTGGIVARTTSTEWLSEQFLTNRHARVEVDCIPDAPIEGRFISVTYRMKGLTTRPVPIEPFEFD